MDIDAVDWGIMLYKSENFQSRHPECFKVKSSCCTIIEDDFANKEGKIA